MISNIWCFQHLASRENKLWILFKWNWTDILRCHIKSDCLVFAQCLLSVCSVPIPCLLSDCSVFAVTTQCLLTDCSMFAQCPLSVCSVTAQCLLTDCSMFAQCLLSACSVTTQWLLSDCSVTTQCLLCLLSDCSVNCSICSDTAPLLLNACIGHYRGLAGRPDIDSLV